MRKFLSLTLPLGLLIEFLYIIVGRFFIKIPDSLAYIILIISMVLMLIGIGYNGYCLGKRENPFNFKKH